MWVRAKNKRGGAEGLRRPSRPCCMGFPRRAPAWFGVQDAHSITKYMRHRVSAPRHKQPTSATLYESQKPAMQSPPKGRYSQLIAWPSKSKSLPRPRLPCCRYRPPSPPVLQGSPPAVPGSPSTLGNSAHRGKLVDGRAHVPTSIAAVALQAPSERAYSLFPTPGIYTAGASFERHVLRGLVPFFPPRGTRHRPSASQTFGRLSPSLGMARGLNPPAVAKTN